MNEDATLAEFAEEMPNLYRECAAKFLRVLHLAVAAMPDSAEKWGVAFATANPCCMGTSMSEVAKRIGVSRATLSFIARKFCEDAGIPPSSHMRTEDGVSTAKFTRREAIRRLAQKIRTTKEPLK
jgi:hypothetical protein